MSNVFLIQNTRTKQALNRQGGWSQSIRSYRLAEFATEAEAINEVNAQKVAGFECEIVPRSKKEPKESASKYEWFLQQHNFCLDTSDAFKARTHRDPSAQAFESEDAALDKAEALSLNLDLITISRKKCLNTDSA